jgi:hypothetical protein
MLCRRLEWRVPAGEDENGRVTLESMGENLCPLYPEAHAVVSDRRQGCLRDTGQRSELVLAQPVQLANKANRLANRNVNAPRAGRNSFILPHGIEALLSATGISPCFPSCVHKTRQR